MNYKVCIPTAGVGSRLGDICLHLNKSLVSIANKPGISHIIEKFPQDIPFVIALGYKGHLVREFLTLAYPKRKFEFVEVYPYEGDGSGLGYSILQCKNLLQCPFIFCSCDTITTNKAPSPEVNWMGYADVDDIEPYRTLQVKGDKVKDICEKNITGDNLRAYIGLAGVHDYGKFWEKMAGGKNNGAIEIGESYGMQALIEKDIAALQFAWFDTGNPQALEKTREALKKPDTPNILDKKNEAIWFINGDVIKFSADEKFIKNRVIRSEILRDFCPEVTDATEHMYKYKKVSGDILSKVITIPLFRKLLLHSKKFWKEQSLSVEGKKQFQSVCMKFYREKTQQRIDLFYRNFDKKDAAEAINSVEMPTMADLINQVDWDWLADGLAGNFHGDYHFENIIYTLSSNKFHFLDWRQEFGGSLETGDIYYDFAKLNHGLIICHELIFKNLFNVYCEDNIVRFDFLRKQILVECEKEFEIFIKANGYDYKKVQILTALIFLNIAALHHYPYSLLLFYLGKSSLFQLLRTGN